MSENNKPVRSSRKSFGSGDAHRANEIEGPSGARGNEFPSMDEFMDKAASGLSSFFQIQADLGEGLTPEEEEEMQPLYDMVSRDFRRPTKPSISVAEQYALRFLLPRMFELLAIRLGTAAELGAVKVPDGLGTPVALRLVLDSQKASSTQALLPQDDGPSTKRRNRVEFVLEQNGGHIWELKYENSHSWHSRPSRANGPNGVEAELRAQLPTAIKANGSLDYVCLYATFKSDQPETLGPEMLWIQPTFDGSAGIQAEVRSAVDRNLEQEVLRQTILFVWRVAFKAHQAGILNTHGRPFEGFDVYKVTDKLEAVVNEVLMYPPLFLQGEDSLDDDLYDAWVFTPDATQETLRVSFGSSPYPIAGKALVTVHQNNRPRGLVGRAYKFRQVLICTNPKLDRRIIDAQGERANQAMAIPLSRKISQGEVETPDGTALRGLDIDLQYGVLYAIVREPLKFDAAHKILFRDYAELVSELFAYVSLPIITKRSIKRFVGVGAAKWLRYVDMDSDLDSIIGWIAGHRRPISLVLMSLDLQEEVTSVSGDEFDLARLTSEIVGYCENQQRHSDHIKLVKGYQQEVLIGIEGQTLDGATQIAKELVIRFGISSSTTCTKLLPTVSCLLLHLDEDARDVIFGGQSGNSKNEEVTRTLDKLFHSLKNFRLNNGATNSVITYVPSISQSPVWVADLSPQANDGNVVLGIS